MACNECNNCLSREAVINLIKNTVSSSSTTSVPVGVITYITDSTLLTNFDSTGKGTGTFNGWAIANGNNGTQNLVGRVLVSRDTTDTDFATIANTGGAKTHTLTTAELAVHTHGSTLQSHNHALTDSGHSHTASSNNQLGAGLIAADGGGTYNVSNGGITTSLSYATIPINGGAPATPSNVEFLVRTIPTIPNLVTSGAVSASATQATSTVTIPTHNHGNPDLTHSHTITVNSSTTGATVNAVATGSEVATTSAGSGNAHNNLQPYMVAVAIQKIN